MKPNKLCKRIPPIAYNGAIVGKQPDLNDLINKSFGKLGHDRLAAALSQPRPGHICDVPTQAHCENMPIAGDLMATAMCYSTVISFAILYVRTVTDASGRQAIDHSYDVIESSIHLIVHAQLMPFEHRPGPDLHVWNGMLNPRVVQVRGEHCQFVNLESNVENKWYHQTSTLKALAEGCIHCAPIVVPTVPRDPYPCMPTAPTGDKVGTDSGPNSVECQISQRTVPSRVLRTHIGQHILRGYHIEGQAERSCANLCGFVDHGTSAQSACRCNRALWVSGWWWHSTLAHRSHRQSVGAEYQRQPRPTLAPTGR